jgi:hypothetical protein
LRALKDGYGVTFKGKRMGDEQKAILLT